MIKKIKLFIIIICFLLLIISGKIMFDEIQHSSLKFGTKIIGSLGKPLGEIITIEGIFLKNDFRNEKSDLGKTLLEVEKVNNQKLKSPIVISIEKFAWVIIEEPEPGKKIKYIGYETGGFTGIPNEAFEHMPYVTTTEYNFEVYFLVCKEIK